ncbi:MAG TPA: radical SAM protein [Bacteroidales bacterium]
MTKHYTIPVFIPELACLFQCVFCNQQKISGRLKVPSDEEIIESIEAHLNSFTKKERIVEIGFFGGSFTGLTLEEQEHFLKLAKPYILKNEIQGIRLSTRPDYISEEILDLLSRNHVSTIELGSQSLDDEVLKASFRGHTAEQTAKAAEMILSKNFKLGLQMMIGLPGDTLEKSIFTAKKIIELGAHSTRIYPTVVIRDTGLHQLYKQGKFEPLSLEDAVNWTKVILPIFEEANIEVLRVGLHPSEGLLDGSELVAGPFHPSFKELVLTEIWADLLKPLLFESDARTIEITVPKKELNYAIGYQGKNKIMLLEQFQTVHFVPDEGITQRNSFFHR